MSFAGRIRDAAKGLTPESFTARDLSIAAGIQTRFEDLKIRGVLRDLHRAGEILRVGRGEYAYVGKQKAKPEIREVMWRLLRARRNTTVEDLMELAEVSEGYAREWLRMLVRRGVVARSQNGRYRMIADPLEMPEDEKKAVRLRGLRREKKARVVEALDKASAAIAEVKAMIEEEINIEHRTSNIE